MDEKECPADTAGELKDYRIEYRKSAGLALRKIPRDTAVRIREKIKDVAKDPYAKYANVKELKGRSGYRLRIGDWRVLYNLEDSNRLMVIVAVRPRGGAYR